MTIEILREVLGWCSLINLGLLLFWAAWLILAHDLVYGVHTRWLKMSPQRFDSLHYAGMLLFKMWIFMFNIVPYMAIRLAA